MKNSFERNYDARAIRGMRKLLRSNPPDAGIEQAKKEVGVINKILIVAFIVFALVVGIVAICRADDKCADPGLNPKAQKACVELVRICKEIGCSVSVR